MNKKIKLWEILVPASKKKHKISYEHHKKCDSKVMEISGGLTILKTTKGQWISSDNTLYNDKMIPVRIACSESNIHKIIDFTLQHYNEECVMAYLISDKVIFKNKEHLNPYLITKNTIRSYIKEGKPFTHSQLQKKIIQNGGVLRTGIGQTIFEYMEKLEKFNIVEYWPKNNKYIVIKNKK